MNDFTPAIDSFQVDYSPNIDCISVAVKAATYENVQAMLYGLVTYLVEHEVMGEDEIYHTMIKAVADGLKAGVSND